MGLCLHGNIAITAKTSLQQPGLKKVAIVDFDVHHGNGTQVLIDDDETYFLFSYIQSIGLNDTSIQHIYLIYSVPCI